MSTRTSRILFSGMLVLFPQLIVASHLAAAETDATNKTPPRALPGLTPLDDDIQPLVPRRQRSESEQDRVHATALYAHARILFHDQKYAQALRKFQRAWRYDPESVTILDEVLKLTSGLRRPDEFGRYAVIRAEIDPKDPALLRRLAGHLTDKDDNQRALKFLYRSLELDKDKKDGIRIPVRMQIGLLHFEEQEMSKAAVQFAEVVKALDDPEAYNLKRKQREQLLDDEARTYALFGESFLEDNRLDAAADMFQRAHQVEADEPVLAWRQARIEAKRDNTDKALELLDKYLDSGSDKGSISPYEFLAELLDKSFENKDEAKRQLLERLNKLYEAKPNPPLGYFLAKTRHEAGRLEEAAELYRKLADTKPTIDAYEALIDIQREREDLPELLAALGETAIQTGRFDSVDESVGKVAENEKLMDKLIDYARPRLEKNEELQDGAALAMGLLCIKSRRYDEADAFFELALRREEPPKIQIMLTWGIDMIVEDENERAAKVLQRAIDEGIVENDQFQFHFYLAWALELAGRTDEALPIAEEAARRGRNFPPALTRRPWVLYHAKRYDEAEKGYKDLLKQLDDNHSSEDIREAVRDARLILSNICVLTDRMPEGEEWLEQVLDEFPEHPGAQNDLGYLWADQGKHLARALKMTRHAVAAEPDNKAYRDSLGWAYFRLGNYEQALKEIRIAADEEEPDGVILDHLADALWATGHREEAIENWKRAVEAFKQQEDLKALEKTEQKLKEHTSE